MTDGRWSELFASISAHRASMVDVIGRLAIDAEMVRGAGLDAIADSLDELARELAAGLIVLTRTADGAQDDTQTMALDEVAD